MFPLHRDTLRSHEQYTSRGTQRCPISLVEIDALDVMSMGKGDTQMEWPAVLQVINSHIYTPSSCFSPVSPRIIYPPFWPSLSVIGKLEMSHASIG